MIKKSKVLLVTICLVIGLFSAVVVEAATYGYLTREEVTKNGLATVHSNATGTNSFAFNYGATRKSGSLTVEVQHYYEGSYLTIVPIKKTLTPNTESSFSDFGQYPGFKMFRIQLSGSGTGSGWIQGRA